MAAGETTQGQRRPDGTELHELQPGEYAFASAERKTLWVCLPNGQHGAMTADRWSITTEGDDSITVSPSIENKGERYWHGYLEHGVWREV